MAIIKVMAMCMMVPPLRDQRFARSLHVALLAPTDHDSNVTKDYDAQIICGL